MVKLKKKNVYLVILFKDNTKVDFSPQNIDILFIHWLIKSVFFLMNNTFKLLLSLIYSSINYVLALKSIVPRINKRIILFLWLYAEFKILMTCI